MCHLHFAKEHGFYIFEVQWHIIKISIAFTKTFNIRIVFMSEVMEAYVRSDNQHRRPRGKGRSEPRQAKGCRSRGARASGCAKWSANFDALVGLLRRWPRRRMSLDILGLFSTCLGRASTWARVPRMNNKLTTMS
jgi:hypothetical protein